MKCDVKNQLSIFNKLPSYLLGDFFHSQNPAMAGLAF
jgi:hypothetical protein